MSFSIRFVYTSAPEGAGLVSEGEERLEEILPDLRRGRSKAVLELRRILTKGVRWFLRREANCQYVDTLVSGIVDDVLSAFDSGRLTTVEEILSFTRSAALAKLDEAGCNPSIKRLPSAEKKPTGAMKRAIEELDSASQQAIYRYIRGDKPSRICSDLAISICEFAALRARLKARFAQLNGAPEPVQRHKLTGWLRANIV